VRFTQLPLGSWVRSHIGSFMIIPNHRVSAVVYRSPTDMVRAAQTNSDVCLTIDVDRGRSPGLGYRKHSSLPHDLHGPTR
jgi:hypothetical protein